MLLIVDCGASTLGATSAPELWMSLVARTIFSEGEMGILFFFSIFNVLFAFFLFLSNENRDLVLLREVGEIERPITAGFDREKGRKLF